MRELPDDALISLVWRRTTTRSLFKKYIQDYVKKHRLCHGNFIKRSNMLQSHFIRAFRVGVAGPVGSGKTMLVDKLSKRLWARYSLAVVTNDIPKRMPSTCSGKGPFRPSECGELRQARAHTLQSARTLP